AASSGAAVYCRGVARALADLGCRVTFHEPDFGEHGVGRYPADCGGVAVSRYAATADGASGALEAARAADVLVKTSGAGTLDAWVESELPGLAAGHRRVVFWDLHPRATLERLRGDRPETMRRPFARYDVVLTRGGGSRLIAEYERLGGRRCVPIHEALDPDAHRPVARDVRFVGDLGYLGERSPDRDAGVHEFFLGPARCLSELKLGRGGTGWGASPDLAPNVRCVGDVHAGDLDAFHGSTRAVLNLDHHAASSGDSSPSARLFEAAGVGACLVCGAWEGIEEFLEPGHEVLSVASGVELVEVVARLSGEAARLVGEAARRRVLAEHTYEQRARELYGLLESRPTVRPVRRQRVCRPPSAA
ncbi:MAG: glycosyltransferase, partial [Pseudomonadota bacterium]